MLGLTFSSKFDWVSYIISIAKTTSKKIRALIHSMKFLSPELLYISKNLPQTHVWNTVVTSGLVPLDATWTLGSLLKFGQRKLHIKFIKVSFQVLIKGYMLFLNAKSIKTLVKKIF